MHKPPGQAVLRFLSVAAVALTACGCGNAGLIKARGHVVRNGAVLLPEKGETLSVIFVPYVEAGNKPENAFPANVDAEGNFLTPGKRGKGIPVGKYRITVTLAKKNKDLLKGAFAVNRTPFIVDLQSPEEIVLDLDKPSP
jgi:hypothetical protein